MSRLGVPRPRVVLIGDTPYDVEAARKATVDTIGVTSDGFSIAALTGEVAVFPAVAELVARWADSPLA